MFNFNSRKNRKIFSSILIIFLILAMVLPSLLSFL